MRLDYLLNILRPAWVAILAAAVSISSIIFASHAWDSLQYPEKQNYTDMDIFVGAAKSYMATGQLYQRTDNLVRDYAPGAGIYKFPPAYQLTIYPFLRLGIDDFWFSFLQRILQLLMYLSASFFMLVLMERKFLHTTGSIDSNFQCWNYRLLGILFVLWSTGFMDAFSGIEPEILVFFLLATGLFLLDSKPFAAGMLVATATAIKLYPALMLLFFIATRNRAGIQGFFTGLVTVTLASVAAFGLSEHLFYLEHVLPVLLTEKPVVHIQNTTIEAMFYYDHTIPAMTGHITTLVKLFTAGILLFICYRSFSGRTGNIVTLYSLFIAALLLCLANYWLQYQVILVIPALCLLAITSKGQHPLCFAILLTVLVALVIQEGPYQDYKQSVIAHLLQEKNFAVQAFIQQHPGIDPVLRFAPHLWLLMRLRDLVFLAPLVLFLSLSYLVCNTRHKIA